MFGDFSYTYNIIKNKLICIYDYWPADSNERNISCPRCIIIYQRNENKLNRFALFIFIGTLKQILILI